MSLIETVARALMLRAEASIWGGAWEDHPRGDAGRRFYLDQARAALEAAAIPTAEMIVAGDFACCRYHGCECEPDDIYRAMLRRELDGPNT